MKKQHFLLALLLLNLIISNSIFAQENAENNFSFPEFEGPYMGQKPPGLIAEPFAPGIISTEGWEVEGVFAPSMKEFYFTTTLDTPFRATIIGFRQENNVWKKFTEFKRNGETAFSPDGNRMYTAEGYRDREGDGWSERKSLGSMFEREDWGIMRLTASAKGTYVFDDYKSGDVIRISKLVNGKRQEPVEMVSVVNTGKWTAHPFIAPDESYLIWDSEREEGFGDSDLYISFKQEDGSWGPAINMGENINTDKWEAFGSVTSDGKYLLFNRGVDDDNVDIFWIDAQIIEKLRNESNFPPLEERYLGQKLPGLTPEMFAPELVSTKENVESLFVFTPDMKKFYFSRHEGEFKKFTSHIVEYKNQKWSKVAELPENISKYREHYDSNYEKFKNLEPFKDFRGFSVSSKGTCFFYDIERDGSGDMYYSRLINGEYESPQKMSEEINAGLYKAHPFVAPDESYLLWDAEKEGEHGADIYISFREKDGSWGKPINMGNKINTGGYEQHARLTPDGKYLFFWRGDENLREDGSTYWKGSPHWVDAKIIETLRPKSTSYEIAYSSTETGYGEVYLTDSQGKSKIKITNNDGNNGYPAWSPDGKYIAFYGKYDDKKTWSIHTMNSDGSNQKRLTHEKNTWDSSPAWSPDGEKITFWRTYKPDDGNRKHEIWFMDADGSNQHQLEKLSGGAPHFLPDGRIVFHSETEEKTSEICISNIDGSNIVQLTNYNAQSWRPEVSPDGKRIAFMSNKDGNHEIYVMDTDGSNQRRLTNNNVRDSTPSWSSDGSQIIFVSRDEEDKTHVYIMNADGSSKRKFINNGGQPAWFKSYK